MPKDAFGRKLIKGQTIIMKNVETLPFVIDDIVVVTELTTMGPVDVTTIRLRVDFPIKGMGDAPMQLYIVKEAEREVSKLVS